MERLSVDGLEVALIDEGQGPPLVFLHNGGTSHAIWLPMMERLCDRFRVIAMDLPGYGASETPEGGATMDTHVAVVDALIRERALNSPVLVGNCMGSAISLTYQQRHPGVLRGLILINPLTAATMASGRLAPFIRFKSAAPELSSKVYGLVKKLKMPRWSAAPIIRAQLGRSGARAGLSSHEPLVSCHASEGQLESLISVLDDIDSYRAVDEYERSEAHPPVAVIWGADNKILLPSSAAQLQRRLQPELVASVDGGGHLVMLEEPDKVEEYISSFISTLPAL